MPSSGREHHVVERSRSASKPVARPHGSSLDLVLVRSDQREIPVDIALAPVVIAGGRVDSSLLDDERQVVGPVAVGRQGLEDGLVRALVVQASRGEHERPRHCRPRGTMPTEVSPPWRPDSSGASRLWLTDSMTRRNGSGAGGRYERVPDEPGDQEITSARGAMPPASSRASNAGAVSGPARNEPCPVRQSSLRRSSS